MTNQTSSKKPLEILQKIWGFDQFRENQEAIINTILEGKNTFVSLPTGGGKSLCYQIPVLCQKGVGIVISPLVALMKDQINNLRKVGIKATDISSGLSQNEITQRIDNCIYGNYKFIYLSPERLSSESIQNQLQNIDVSLLIFDEAHCISQWGHDFRPSYLKVGVLKELFPKTPIICLTASATSEVKKDIFNTLALPEVVSFDTSYERKNIAYSIYNIEDKLHYVRKIVLKNTASSIIYVRNRKATVNWANQLNQLGISSTFYHGSLSSKEKNKNMQLWMDERAQVMVATNAFGMGIDKANVQSVIHIDIPENIENYYQESGRAGRNGKPAHAVILFANNDIEKLRYQTLNNLFDNVFLLHFYKKLCSYLQIAYGEGLHITYSLSLTQFCKKNNFTATKAYQCLLFLEKQNCIEIEPDFIHQTIIRISISPSETIQMITDNTSISSQLLLLLIRNYPGIYETKTAVNLELLTQKSKLTLPQLHREFSILAQNNCIEYLPETTNVVFKMMEIREDEYTINRISKYLAQYNTLKEKRLNAVIDYVTDKSTCLNLKLLAYFGEQKTTRCGICSNCIKSTHQGEPMALQIQKILSTETLSSKDIALVLQADENLIIEAIHELLNNNTIGINATNCYYLK